MEDSYLILIAFAGMIYDCYQELARGNKKAFDVLAFLIFAESSYYNRFLCVPKRVIDDIIDNFGKENDNSAITFAFDQYSKDKIISKRICDRLNIASKIASMKVGAALIPDEADFSKKEDLIECKSYFEEYFKLLNSGIMHINLAYFLSKDNFKNEAYKLAFVDDFVEKSLLFYHGEFKPYDPNMQTLLDELSAITYDALVESNADIAEVIMDYMDIYYESKDNILRQQLIDMILSLSTDDVEELMDTYNDMLKCNQIENEKYQEYRRLIMTVNSKKNNLK